MYWIVKICLDNDRAMQKLKKREFSSRGYEVLLMTFFQNFIFDLTDIMKHHLVLCLIGRLQSIHPLEDSCA